MTATTSAPTSDVPTEFPIPIMPGGVTESEYATEVTVLYPESSYDQLLAYYDEFADTNDGTASDLFEGREWHVQGIQILVTPVDPSTHPNRPPGVVLFIRLP